MTRQDEIDRERVRLEGEAHEAMTYIIGMQIRIQYTRDHSANPTLSDVLDALDDVLTAQLIYAQRALETAGQDVMDAAGPTFED